MRQTNKDKFKYMRSISKLLHFIIVCFFNVMSGHALARTQSGTTSKMCMHCMLLV